MTRPRLAQALVAIAAAAMLAACAPAPWEPSAEEAPQLAALREQQSLPDCPPTDPGAPAVDGGLPRTALRCLGGDADVNLAGLPRVPTIVNLWAQWCGPCREEAPYLREGLAELDEVAFVGVNYKDTRPDWAIEFAGAVGWRYPHVVDRYASLHGPLKVPGLPTTYFVDASGRIAGVHSGPLTSADQLRTLARQYLGVG